MKTSKYIVRGTVLAIATALFVFAGSSFSQADEHHDHEAWSHDHHGYWDNHYQYHSYVVYHSHHGYWRPNPNGVLFFINID